MIFLSFQKSFVQMLRALIFLNINSKYNSSYESRAHMMNLNFGITFNDLYSHLGLKHLDEKFLFYLKDNSELLAQRLEDARKTIPKGIDYSSLLIDLAPHVEDFVGQLFHINQEISDLQSEAYALAPLYKCKRQFIQRMATKAYTREEAIAFDGEQLRHELSYLMAKPYSDLAFAISVLKALDDNDIPFIDLAKQYAAWALHQPRPSVLFKLPQKIDPEHRVDGRADSTPPTLESALDHSHYCIFCHNQGKDSCSTGHSVEQKGCPLGQKISEMNTLRTQGHPLGALAVILIDNPMVAATGRRICNDCMKACIFQKQDPVDIPSIETQTLDSVLNLPWGVEIYGLFSRWNPLNLQRPFPLPPSGYKVMVAGMGPAGFTLAHYLLNEGHAVVGIDGLKIEPLDKELLTQPIQYWSDIKQQTRTPAGFGGVTEYGITARWDKNYLTLVRLLLERRSHFSLYDNIRLGGTLTIPQVFELGFDHLALCLGSGQPNTLNIPNAMARGVRMASDFLMALQLSDTQNEDSMSNLQIRLPVIVIGGGLTAVDTAAEVLVYYPKQVAKFRNRFDSLKDILLSQEESEIAKEFLDDQPIPIDASTIVYRKRMQDSPSYKLNPEELDIALQQGVQFMENATPEEVIVDEYGHIKILRVSTPEGTKDLPCKTLLIATGTQPNRILETEDNDLTIKGNDFFAAYTAQGKVSYFGDLHPSYNGNVVKAMASAKNGYPMICKSLLQSQPHHRDVNLDDVLKAHIHSVHRLTPTIIELVIHAPQASRNFKPGQFFRLQTYGSASIEGIALTGAHTDVEKGLLSLIVLELGGSSDSCHLLEPTQPVALMGPTGAPTEIPSNETVLLIGGGLGNAVLFSIGKALKENGNRVIYVAGYKVPEDQFKAQEIEAVADHVIWCCETNPGLTPRRPQDFAYVGNVIEGLLAYSQENSPILLTEVDRIITIGSDRMMAAVSCARRTILKPYLKDSHKAICSLNASMQCMMKGICGQCIQTKTCLKSGHTEVIFSCVAQDQLMDEIHFDVLQNRLQQNSLLEKQTKAWLKNVRN